MLYYIAYTIDYLLNRHDYSFDEEKQHKDNKLIFKDSVFTKFMTRCRRQKLQKMEHVDAKPVPEIDINDLTPEVVAHVSQKFTEPFVVRGLIKDFDCVKKWNLDYFEEKFGDIEVLAFTENNVSYSRTKHTSVSESITIRDICAGIKEGKPLYINNISKLFTVNSIAQSDLNLDKIDTISNVKFFPKSQQHKTYFMSQLFLGGKNTGTSLHCANNINFFFNIAGVKRWGFISPRYTPLINCQTSARGLFAVCDDDFFSSDAFSKIPRYETYLQPGDFLFNPAWYWHAVQNKSDYTIAVANRYIYDLFEIMPHIGNNIFFSFLQLFSIKYYWSWLTADKKKKTYQEVYGNLVDQEIINNLSQSKAI